MLCLYNTYEQAYTQVAILLLAESRRVEVCEGREKEEEAEPVQCFDATDDLCLMRATHLSVSIFPTGFSPTHSPTSPASSHVLVKVKAPWRLRCFFCGQQGSQFEMA